MTTIRKIKSFWDDKARNTKSEMGGTLEDETLRKMEIQAISHHLRPNCKVLDIGCGNGFSTIHFARTHQLRIRGMDYSAEMIHKARALLAKQGADLRQRIDFVTGDIMDPVSKAGKYDVIVTERCLINLAGWKNQQQALKNIHAGLRKGGRFLMLEGFLDNLAALNQIRAKFQLKPIKVVWHNVFFERDRFERFINDYFAIEGIDNFASTYMLITRSYLHALQRDRVGFEKRWDELAALLPNFGDYNYQRLYVLRKR